MVKKTILTFFLLLIFQGRGGKGTEAPNVNDEMSFPSLG